MIIELAGVRPTIAEDVYIAPTAVVIGNVTILPGANIWFGAVLRGDSGRIVVGRRVSVQDNVVVHVNERADTIIGDDVLLGHGAILEGCRIGAGALVGMGATPGHSARGPGARAGGAPGARSAPLPGDGAALYARRPGDWIKKIRPHSKTDLSGDVGPATNRTIPIADALTLVAQPAVCGHFSLT
jgi:acetyltransferase-like isoleucine patch superfamily enzyme